MANRESIVVFTNVRQKFRDQIIFHRLDFSFYKGEIVCLFAPSGVGKTTLMKMMTGLIRATSGNVEVLHRKMPYSRILQEIGYMGQEDALYDELTSGEHLKYFGAMYNIHGRILRERSSYILDFLKLSADTKKIVRRYSGGMKKRLSLGIALLHDPCLLILDEPTVGIDPALRRSFWEKFAMLKKEGKTLIISTHLMDEILKADRVLMLGEKQILAFGTPEELIKESGCQNMDEAYIYYHNKALTL